jgi:glycosyltransferase involved in cell wall biosynthesis
MNRRLLIYEPLTGGHRPDFIRHLVAQLGREPRDEIIRFALPPGFFENEPALETAIRGLAPNVELVQTPDRPATGLALLQAVEAFHADRLLLLELTRWENFLCRHRLPCDLAGILFVQYPEIDWQAASGRERWTRWLRRQVKDAKTALWLQRQSAHAIFLLNGDRACDWLNRRFPARPVFRPLPDPAPDGAPSASARTEGEPRGFLFPGVLSARKGCLLLLEALTRIRPETAGRAEFQLLGPAEQTGRQALCRAVARLRRLRPDVRLVLEDHFVPEDEFRSRMARADWILMPYLRPEYSSGILVRAAMAGTPVLGPRDGLLGRLIESGALGRTTRIEPASLARAIDEAVVLPMQWDPAARGAFLERSRPERFAAALLKCFD